MPSFDTSGNILEAEQDFVKIGNLSAGSLSSYIVQDLDIGTFRWMSLQIFGVFSGVLTFYGRNDITAQLETISLVNISNGVFVQSTNTHGIFTGPINFQLLTIQMTSYTSGTAQAILNLYYQGSTPAPMNFLTVQGIAGNNTPLASDQNNTQLQVSLYGKNVNPGDQAVKVGASGNLQVALQASSSAIGKLNACNYTIIAAGTATDTTIKSSSGTFYGMMVIASPGAGVPQAYDGTTANIIGVLPSNSPVGSSDTTPSCGIGFNTNLKVTGNAANPSLLVLYI